jgi:Acylphosphatases
MVRRRVTARGRVQGVGFRYTCARAARAVGVSGWVRNRADGTVEAVFEGEPGAVEQLIEWMRSGPPGALVTGVDIAAEKPSGAPGFEIR